jgi:hypothetical protein
MAFRQWARSTTSGSRAAFSMTVTPSASAAAIIRFSVPVTVTMSQKILAPRRRLACAGCSRARRGSRRPSPAGRLMCCPPAARRWRSRRAATPALRHARQQRAQGQDRGAHGLDHVVGGLRVVEAGGRRARSPPLVERDVHAHLRQQAQHGRDVVEVRHVAQMQRLGGEQRGAENRQRGVLGAGNGSPRRRAARRPSISSLSTLRFPFRRRQGASSTGRGSRRCRNAPAQRLVTACWRWMRFLPTNSLLTISASKCVAVAVDGCRCSQGSPCAM